MIKQNKGYSLGVLVITIAVMMILTSVAIVSFKNVSSDRIVTNFMNDVQEVEEYVKEYVSVKHTLPIEYDEENNPRVLSDYYFEQMKSQTNENDFGKYYYVDLTKLERIHLKDATRGYVMNENSLRVYVDTPIIYDGMLYYTITDNMKGYQRSYNDNANFEVLITGNPSTWTDKARLMLSVPSLSTDSDSETLKEVLKKWTFKYYEDGPITASEFKNKGKLFLYGEIVEVSRNGIVSFYVENEKGYSRVINAVITMVDDISPSIDLENGKVVILDHETGINPDKIYYKIIGYDEDLTDGTDGRPLLAYGTRYKKYIEEYQILKGKYDDLLSRSGELMALGSGETEILNELTQLDRDITRKNNENRDFNDSHVPYSDTERNIALYVEDYAGNTFAFRSGVSRENLLNSELIDYEMELLSNSTFSVVKNSRYISGDIVYLRIRSQGATKMLITMDPDHTLAENLNNYIDFHSSNGGYSFDISGATGEEITIYAYYTAEERDELGALIYEALSDSFLLDKVAPTNETPEVTVSNKLELTIEVKQTDSGSGIGQVEYGYMLASGEENLSHYTWVSEVSQVQDVLQAGKKYHIRTRASDVAGNGPTISLPATIQCPEQKIIAIPNAPILGTMKAITWKPNLDEVEINPATLKDSDGVTRVWYDYAMGDGISENNSSKWANAKSTDGSYWVWIPRFGYKIVYYTNSSKTDIKGYYQTSPYTNVLGYYLADGKTLSTENTVKTAYGSIEIVFLYNTEDNKYFDQQTKTVKSLVEGEDKLYSEYIVHPAFQGIGGAGTINALGKWSRELSGIWVAKFETSRSDATYSNIGTATTIKSVPSVKSMSNISINQAFNYATNYDTYTSSHLMKNSEWGAISYLAYSAYGRNGARIKPNLATNQITGGGSTTNGATYAATSQDLFESRYGYKTSSGFTASTTNNIYGVYDMVGGNEEFVSSYVDNANSVININGSDLQNTSTAHKAQVYQKGSSDTSALNFEANSGVYGDGIYEIAISSSNLWGNCSMTYPQTGTPFFTRGGNYSLSSSTTGIFTVSGVSGANNANTGFRVVLAP